MKLFRYLNSLMIGAALVLTACQPDEYELGGENYTADQLVEGKAFTVTPDAADPNVIHLKAIVKGATPLWETPQGRSQKENMTLELPFAGNYQVTFGVMTPAGPVYGAPYEFTVTANNFGMLDDPKWANLAGGVGKTKKWYPMNNAYGIGRCSGPVMYLDPDHVNNDGVENKDLQFGSDFWTPNWDPGFQDWLIPASDPYMQSYMEFGLDAAKGCTAVVFRNDNTGGTLMNGKFVLNLSDAKHPTITFENCYTLHNTSFDAVCANYTTDIKIVELTPYLLQIATMRTNDEGPWWLIWNFASEEVIETNGECIPKEDSGELVKAEPVLPEIDDLETKLFTTEINGVTYVGNQMTFNLDTEAPYDWLWWNGSQNVQAWESVTNGVYDQPWKPAAGEDIADFELVIENGKDKDGNQQYKYTAGDLSGTCQITASKIVFDQEITLLTAASDLRTVAITGKEFVVMKCDAGETLTLAVPDGQDENGLVNNYLTANLLYKKITTGPVGPTVIPVDNSKLEVIFGDGNKDRLRIQLYNSWGGKNECFDITKLKLKKNQTLTIQYKVTEGITWNEGAAPKTVIMENIIGNKFEDDCYGLEYAAAFDTTPGATQTVTLTNTTGASVTFEKDCCLVIGIQNKGLATVLDADEDGMPDVKVEITSMTVQ